MPNDNGLNQRTWELMSETGHAFFSSVVEHIATILGLRIAFIVEAMDVKGKHVAPLASWGVQEFRGNQGYDTQGTPCERLSSGTAGIYLNNLPNYFPDDPWLLQSGMQSYVAIPLLDEHAHVLGYMGVLDDREMENSENTIAVLESYAKRAKQEILRKRNETGLLRILGESNWLLYRATPPQFSPRLQTVDEADFLGYDQSELSLYEDIRCRQLFEEDRSRVLSTFTNAFENGQDFVIQYRLWDRQRETLYHFRDHGRIERDASGQPIAIVGALVNITQQQKNDETGQSDEFTLDQINQNQTLKKLHESEQHFRALFDNSSCGLLFTDPETQQFLECNNRICELLGYSKEELKQLGVVDIHREEDLPWVLKEFQRLVNSEKSQSLNIPVKRKDGSLFYANISSFWIKHQGKDCLVCAFFDVTVNRKTEQALRLEKEKLASYLDNAPVMTLVLDEHGTVLLINQAGCEALGRPVENIIGENWFDQFLPPRLQNKMKQKHDEMINNDIEPVKLFQSPIINAQGKERMIVWHNSTLRNKQGRIIGSLRSGEDITDKQKAELVLKEQEVRLAYAQKLSHVGSWELDLVNDTERWSDEVFRIFGYAPQAFIPSESRKLESIHPDDRELFQSNMRRGLATRETFDFEFRAQRSNGEIRFVRALNKVTRDQKGRAISLLGTLQDVTQRRQAEAQLKRSHEELRQLADHLQSVRESERISIARAIHDDMAQSLTAQKIDLVRLKSRLPQDDSFLMELSGEILKSVNQTIHSVQSILTELRPALLDDLGLVAAIEWQVSELQRKTKMKCHFSLPDEEPNLTDKERTALFRIMQESLSNVLRHSKATEVRLELIVNDSSLLMNIIDNGKGISDNEVLGSHSFGLMGMRERAYIFGGTVKIYGEDGKGTTVSVRIPLNLKPGKVN